MPGAGSLARSAARINPRTNLPFGTAAQNRQLNVERHRLITKERHLAREHEKLRRPRADFAHYRAQSLLRIEAERAEVTELQRLGLQQYQRLAKWGLQRQLKAIDHVSMRAVKVATLMQEGMDIRRREQEESDRDIKFIQLRAVIKQLEDRVASIYGVAAEFFASEVTMRMDMRCDLEEMRRLADEATCAIGYYSKSLPRVGPWDSAAQMCEYCRTVVQCGREISEAVQGLEPLECVYDSH